MNNLDKAINELLQLMLVDNKPSYLTQLNELYECKKKEIEIQQCISRANSLLYSDYAQPALLDLSISQLQNPYTDIGYTLNELADKHKLDPTLLKLVLDNAIKDGVIRFVSGVLDYKTHLVTNRYIGNFRFERPTYS